MLPQTVQPKQWFSHVRLQWDETMAASSSDWTLSGWCVSHFLDKQLCRLLMNDGCEDVYCNPRRREVTPLPLKEWWYQSVLWIRRCGEMNTEHLVVHPHLRREWFPAGSVKSLELCVDRQIKHKPQTCTNYWKEVETFSGIFFALSCHCLLFPFLFRSLSISLFQFFFFPSISLSPFVSFPLSLIVYDLPLFIFLFLFFLFSSDSICPSLFSFPPFLTCVQLGAAVHVTALVRTVFSWCYTFFLTLNERSWSLWSVLN